MKILLVCIALSVCHLTLSQPTACQYVEITDPLHRQLLFQYGVGCESAKGGFYGDKGIILLTESADSTGQRVWYLSAAIDDQYKNTPPKRWTNVAHYIILIYEGSNGSTTLNQIKPNPIMPTPELLACLADVVRDRVYIRPAKAERFVVEQRPGKPKVDKDGNPVRRVTHDMIGGNTSNSLYIRFNKDGTYKKLRPV